MSITQTQLFDPPLRGSNLPEPLQKYLLTLQNLLPLVIVNTAAGNVSIALPAAGLNSTTGQSNQNQEIIYIKSSADAHSLSVTGAISGTATTSTQYGFLRFKSDGTNWWAAGATVPGSLPPSGAAGGDLSGTYPNPTVVQVNGAAIPTSKTIVGTDGSGHIIDASAATLANNTTGTAANLSGTPALPNGTAATTQAAQDNSTKLATTAYVDRMAAIINSAGIGWCFGGFPVGAMMFAPTGNESFCNSVANRVCFVQWVVTAPITIREVTVNIGVLSAGGKVFCAIYDKSKNLVSDLTAQASGAISTSATGNITVTLTTPVTIEPGVYFWAYSSDNTTCRCGYTFNILLSSGATALVNLLNKNSVRYGTGSNAVSAGAMPASLGTLTSNITNWLSLFLLEP